MLLEPTFSQLFSTCHHCWCTECKPGHSPSKLCCCLPDRRKQLLCFITHGKIVLTFRESCYHLTFSLKKLF